MVKPTWHQGAQVVGNSDFDGTPLTRPTSVTVLTLTGIAAAFGAASCCGLPLLLATAWIGSAWLSGIAVMAAPYRVLLLALGAIGLAGAGFVLLWQSRRAVCAPGSLCASSVFRGTVFTGLLVGAVLLYLGYTYA
jgi:mercuric ion transport protein